MKSGGKERKTEKRSSHHWQCYHKRLSVWIIKGAKTFAKTDKTANSAFITVFEKMKG